jgi:hypothetical protein
VLLPYGQQVDAVVRWFGVHKLNLA